jgi:hypothetical protein
MADDTLVARLGEWEARLRQNATYNGEAARKLAPSVYFSASMRSRMEGHERNAELGMQDADLLRDAIEALQRDREKHDADARKVARVEALCPQDARGSEWVAAWALRAALENPEAPTTL